MRALSIANGTCSRCWFLLLIAALIVGMKPHYDRAAIGFAQDKQAEPSQADQEPTFSGPQPGETVKPFQVLYIHDDEPAELEILKDRQAGVTLICFVHRLSTDDRVLFGLGLVDFYALRHKDLTSHFVLLSDDREKITTMLRGWKRGALFNKSLVSVSLDGSEGPGYYGLNRNVAMTVLVIKGDEVVNNLVFNAPNGQDLEVIMAAVAKALGKPEPTLSEVQLELRADRQRQLDMKIKASPIFKLAPDEQLGRIMYGMVNGRGNPSQIAQRQTQQILSWVGDDQNRKSALQQYCKSILTGEFELNQYSREAIRKLAGD